MLDICCCKQVYIQSFLYLLTIPIVYTSSGLAFQHKYLLGVSLTFFFKFLVREPILFYYRNQLVTSIVVFVHIQQ